MYLDFLFKVNTFHKMTFCTGKMVVCPILENRVATCPYMLRAGRILEGVSVLGERERILKIIIFVKSTRKTSNFMSSLINCTKSISKSSLHC
jgi:hypothetical protein